MQNKYSLAQLAAIYCTYKDLSVTTHNVVCCTCGKVIKIEQLEDSYSLWGHYIPRSVNRKLIFYPKNSHVQCIQCNVFTNRPKLIQENYDKFMIYRYGDNILDELNSIKQETEDYYFNFYIEELTKLLVKFPELAQVVLDKDTGELKDTFNGVTLNSIEKQFYTFSRTYGSDLDNISKSIKGDYIEYNRL